MNKVDWSYYNKFEEINKKYLPDRGEGETKASQMVTAINKLIYKWYNDGDVYDNTCYLQGWCNDLSSFANWLAGYIDGAVDILDRIFNVDEDGYEMILKDLADTYLNEEQILNYTTEKEGSIYNSIGRYKFNDNWEDEENW